MLITWSESRLRMIPNDPKTRFIPGEDSIGWGFAICVCVAICLMGWGVTSGSHLPFYWWTLACGIFALMFSKCDFLNPLPPFVFPWMTIILFRASYLSL